MPATTLLPPLPTRSALKATKAPAPPDGDKHVPQLDGWRGISIACVLAAHMLPLGPKWLHLNDTAAAAGMALFFTLSGYLITSTLVARPDPRAFLIRRGCRILPLALGFQIAVLTAVDADAGTWVSNLLFVTNYDPASILVWNSPLWSLCVEIHFYLFVAFLVAVGGRRALWVLPLVCVGVTAGRMATGATISNYTHLRVDEILAGACLALLRSHGGPRVERLLGLMPTWAAAAVLFAAAGPWSGPLQYARPYAAALLVGGTLTRDRGWAAALLSRPALKYLATISFALYVLHPVFYRGWMDEGSTTVRYLVKRPISFVLLFAAAHLSTHTFEAWWINFGKRLTARPRG